ncbi:TilS substrate-binding domain-containing protein [Georgenia sp. TF02-10]|uniref:tRNA lysidine(34) synthetase n=1 Tax=Georgenia sp. TF02-10 TaxID=2917725 RepID=UPI001FA78BEE|nr:ATP-binding protein [Georgenia sp. TF02-10]UNX54487.1 TilS substrate-binding domain-containing protein [Georgenia sp. TF02-10]
MGGPAPAVAAARSAVAAALADLPPGSRVLVACSGGPDSLALAAATAFHARRAGLLAGAVVVDHGLRPDSATAAARAAAACRELGLEPVEVRRVHVGGRGPDGGGGGRRDDDAGSGGGREYDAGPGGRQERDAGPDGGQEPSGGPEAAARAARYAALTAAASDHGAAAVLLGHTLEDQAETVLLGLARGSGARSLAGMPPVRGIWRRPFLSLRRGQTEAVCRALGLIPEEDPTNLPDGPWRAADGSALRRAAVRAQALPALTAALGPGVVPALARTADQLRRDADLLEALAADLLAAATVPAPPDATPPTAVVLDLAPLAAAHPALRTRALHAAARQAGATPAALAAVHVGALDALVVGYHGQGRIPLPGGVGAERRCGRLYLGPAAGR